MPTTARGPLCEGRGCVRGAAGGERRQASRGLRLCRTCTDALAMGIRELGALYEECGRALDGSSTRGPRERTTGGPLPGLPFNGAAADARTAIVATLASWSGLIAAERSLAVPGRGAGQLAHFLLRNTAWLAAHPAAGEASEEVAGLVERARRVARPDPVRRIRVGTCVAPGCDGDLTAAVRARAWARDTEIRCDRHPDHSWAGHQWTQLRRDMQRSASAAGSAAASGAASATGSVVGPERWLSAADISRLWGAPTGTVYRLASEQGWRRRNRDGRTYYSEADAHECFSRRAARSASS
ncbi:hypothetical protein [Streptomyces sp. NPDC002825]|uniref:hypothetical protein n=1 Tax=Streptomyces sp. NPDC002825 TaxID=3154666 RepID=UPI0033337F79